MRDPTGWLFGALVAVFGADSAAATEVSALQDIDRGWYNDDGVNEAANTNYLVGECTAVDCLSAAEYHNFFVFDISAVDSRIAEAVLRLRLPAEGFVSPSESELYELFSVELTDQVGERWGVDIFEDLGSGVSYGSYLATETDEGTFIEIALNNAAIADLNSTGDLFALGGALVTLDADLNNELLFGSSGRVHAELLLTTVPIPAAFWLLASGVAMLGWPRRVRV